MYNIFVTADAGYRLHKACFGFFSAYEPDEIAMQKAIGHKYIRKVPKKNGKGFYYIYAEAFKKPLQVLKTMFGIREAKIENDFVEHNIEKEYGADKKTFAIHILEYFTNKVKWDGIFSRRENRAQYKQAVNTRKTPQEKQSGGAEKKDKPEQNTTMKVNRSLMYKVWSIYKDKADSSGGDDGGDPPDGDISNLENILKDNKIPFPKGSGTKDRYNELFENGVDTPIGKVKMGEHQYEKFFERNRTNLIEAAYSTLTAPTLIINDNGSKLFIKTFEIDNKGLKNIVSVVITKDGNNISVSTHEKRLEQLLKKAKKSRDVIYITDTGNHGTVRHNSVADTQSIAHSGEKSSGDENNKKLKAIKRNLDSLLTSNVDKLPTIQYTRENYEKIFPDGKIETPIGIVKMGEHQFEKLNERGRQYLLGAVAQTLSNPIAIINDNGAKLFIKSFTTTQGGIKRIVSVVVKKDGENISISTHEKTKIAIENKIKNAEDVVFFGTRGSNTNAEGQQDNGSAEPTPSIVAEDGSLKTGNQSPTASSIAHSGEKSSVSLSEAMLGNDNAKKDFAEQEKERVKNNERRQKEGLPSVGLFERESALEDATWDHTSENYRYKDTGYIAGSRKELAQNYIKQAAKEKRQVLESDIDWEGLEENPRLAKQLITKSNVFGQVDWETLKQNGMTGGTAFLLDRVYASVASDANDNPESRRNYVVAINGLRSRLEDSKTVQELVSRLSEINDEIEGTYIPLEHQAEYLEVKNQLETLEHERKKELEPRYEYLKSIVAKYPNSTQKLHKLLSKFDKTFNTQVIKDKYRATESILEKKLETIIQLGIRANPLRSVLMALGDRFTAVLNYRGRNGSTTFASHVADARRGKYDNWQWADKETTVTKGATKQRINFELKVASRFNRKGGRTVSVKSTEELKKMFNLRDIQSGNWVLKDPESAKFHVDHACEGFADLADITGIPDSLISFNGRLALAIGARGSGGLNGGATAHYEPVERVINITKMKGGGCLAHEWFHSFDNLISEAMQGGNINTYLTNPYNHLTKKQADLLRQFFNVKNDSRYTEEFKKIKLSVLKNDMQKLDMSVPQEGSQDEYVLSVRAAFDNLVKTMTEGNVPIESSVMYSERDYNVAKYNFDNAYGGLAAKIKDAGTLEKAIAIINKTFEGKTDKKNAKSKSNWLRITCAYYDGKSAGGTAVVKTGQTKSKFYIDSRRLDGNDKKKYWSSSCEMAARAFSSYIDDALRESGRLNDYLAFAATNEFYKDYDEYPYPEGDERKKINAAFAQLFKVVKKTGAIRKALNFVRNKNIKDVVFANAAIVQKLCGGM